MTGGRLPRSAEQGIADAVADLAPQIHTNPHCEGECVDEGLWCPYCLPSIRRWPAAVHISPSGRRSHVAEWWCCNRCGAELLALRGTGPNHWDDDAALVAWAAYHGACPPHRPSGAAA